MSSRKTHNIVGGVAGGISALVKMPPGQPPLCNIAEIIGGIVGGVAGSRLPDIIEPAIHSYHRQFFHSVVAGGTVTYGLAQQQVSPSTFFRDLAANAHQRATQVRNSGLPSFIDDLMELFFHFLAGAATGLPVGYVSHLLCDATTPRSIPLI